MIGRNADPGVFDGKANLPARGAYRLTANRQGDATGLGELDRIADKIDEDLSQTGGIRDQCARQFAVERVAEVELLFRRAQCQKIEGPLDTFPQVKRMYLELQFSRFDFRKVENIVDDREEVVAAGTNRSDPIPLLGIQRGIEKQS